jgi:serine/threonine protein phosphatase PrpC
MSRSFGDLFAHAYGVIHEPEITHHRIKPEDRFMIIASDGLWEFISSQKAVEIVGEMLERGQVDKT